MKEFVKDLEKIPQVLFAFLVWTLLLVGAQFIASLLTDYSFWLGLGFWALLMMGSIKPFMVSVPEVTELVTVNTFGGGLNGYKTGFHFVYPWEQVKMGNYINLRLHPVNEEEDYPAQDGPKMHAKWQLQYKVVDAVKYIEVGRNAIEDMLKKVGSSKLSACIAQHPSQWSKDNQGEVEGHLKEGFLALGSVKDLYGIEIPVVALADLDYDLTTQKVRATEEVARRIKKIAQDLQTTNPQTDPRDPRYDPSAVKVKAEEALNNAMILHGNVTKHVNQVEGEGGNALAALLMAMSQGGGPKKGSEK